MDQNNDIPSQETSPLLQFHSANKISIPLANRTLTQTLVHVITSDYFSHLVFILLLFIGTATTYNKACLEWLYPPPGRPDRWFAVYDSACGNLRFQIFAFCVAFFLRYGFDASQASEGPDGIWSTPGEPRWRRLSALGLVWLNIIISVIYIFLQLSFVDLADLHRIKHC